MSHPQPGSDPHHSAPVQPAGWPYVPVSGVGTPAPPARPPVVVIAAVICLIIAALNLFGGMTMLVAMVAQPAVPLAVSGATSVLLSAFIAFVAMQTVMGRELGRYGAVAVGGYVAISAVTDFGAGLTGSNGLLLVAFFRGVVSLVAAGAGVGIVLLLTRPAASEWFHAHATRRRLRPEPPAGPPRT